MKRSNCYGMDTGHQPFILIKHSDRTVSFSTPRSQSTKPKNKTETVVERHTGTRYAKVGRNDR